MAMRPVAKSVYCRPKTHQQLMRYCRRSGERATEVVDRAILAELAAAAKRAPRRPVRK